MLLSSISHKEWERITSKFNDVHILQTSDWGHFKSEFGWDIFRIAGENSGAQILFKKLPVGLTWAYLPKGPFGKNWEEIWPEIDNECKSRRAVFLKIEPDYWEGSLQHVEPAIKLPVKNRKSEHSIQPPRTLVIDISGSFEEILARMKQKTRYNIRLADKKGVKVFSSSNIDRFYQLCTETGNRDQFGIHSQNYYTSVYDKFSKKEQCELLFAEFEGKLLAATMVFCNNIRAWYFYGASSNEYRNLMASYAAQWAAIKWARGKGCKEYDLWGVPDNELDELETQFTQQSSGLWGVYRFKRGFGGCLRKSYPTIDRVYNPYIYVLYKMLVKKRLS